LKGNNITDVHPSTFPHNSKLTHLDISGNKLPFVHLHTFSFNRELQWLDLQNNTITDIHPSTCRNNSKMEYLDLYSNLLSVIHPNTFRYNVNLKFLSVRNNITLDITTGFLSGINHTYWDLSGNSIRYLNISEFGNQGQLETLIISGIMLQSLEPCIFIGCTKLRNLSLSSNRISGIIISLFYGLEQLEQLGLSKNVILELNPLVFDSLSTSTNPQNHQVSTLKHLSIIRSALFLFLLRLF